MTAISSHFAPPVRTDIPVTAEAPDEVQIDGLPAFVDNGLSVDFQKETFDRSDGGDWDPSFALMQRTVDSFLTRLRYVSRSSHIRPLDWPRVQLRVSYLNDDGSELAEQKGFIRARGIHAFRLSVTSVSEETWEHVHSLPLTFSPPTWDSLRLDANAFLQDVGTSVVLAATCLEVCISHLLDELARRSDLPPELWEWLNNRSNWLADPSTADQFDTLLKLFTKHSLKEEKELWEAFQNLKTARNQFVHEGTPMIGGKLVSKNEALQLLIKLNQIIAWVRDLLPQEARWPEFEIKSEMTFEKKLL